MTVSCTEPPVAVSEMSDASMPYRVASCCRVAASSNWLMSMSSASSLVKVSTLFAEQTSRA